MAFEEVRFPVTISYGSSGGPGYKTQVISTFSGMEQRVARWSKPRRRYNVAYGVKDQEDLAEVQTFFVAVRGAEIGFRFKDWLDYTTKPDGHTAAQWGDQALGVGDGVTKAFQLRKWYALGALLRPRKITKPVINTVGIGIEGVQQLSGWSVDTTTGIVTFDTAPSVDDLITWGGEFDVPVRFDESTDELLSATIEDFQQGAVESLMIIELNDGSELSEEPYRGNASALTMQADREISPLNGTAITLYSVASGKNLIMPLTSGLPCGGPYFAIFNDGGNAVTIKAEDGSTTICSLSAGASVEMWLGKDGSGLKTWYAIA